MRYRLEKDIYGEVQIPIDAYYGIYTARAKSMYSISGNRIHKQMIKALSIVKKSFAFSNLKVEKLEYDVADSIMLACDDVLNGKFTRQFITDMIQGGSGTAMNINMDEVLANRANEIMGGEKGTYEFVHPFNHVSLGQTTDDIISISGKIATIKLVKKLQTEMKKLHRSYLDKANEFMEVKKLAREHLQDAIPISFGFVFSSYASPLERDMKRLQKVTKDLYSISISPSSELFYGDDLDDFKKATLKKLRESSKLDLSMSKYIYDSTINLDNFLAMSATIKSIAINLSKVANDIRLMQSLEEIFVEAPYQYLPRLKGKSSSSVSEAMNQIAFEIIGNDVTISKAVEAGQLELNAFQPIILANIFFSIDILRKGIEAFREYTIGKIKVNKEKCQVYIERSSGVISLLSPHIGYDEMSKVAKLALDTNQDVIDLIVKEKLLTKEDINDILSYKHKIQQAK